MPFKHGRLGKLLFNGIDLSSYFRGAELTVDAPTADVTTWGNAGWRSYIAGLLSATYSFDGLYDPTETALQAALTSQTAGALMFCPGSTGSAAGDAARIASVYHTSWGQSDSLDDAAAVTWEVATSGAMAFGQVLHPSAPSTGTPNGHFGVDTSGWAAFAGGSIARSVAEFHTTPASARVTAIASANTGAQYALGGTYLSGRTYRLNLWAMTISGATPTWNFQLGVPGGDGFSVSSALTGAMSQTTVDWKPSADRTGVAIVAQHVAASVAVCAIDDVTVELLDAGKDDAASTSTGWSYVIHATAAGAATYQMWMEDSADNITWALVTGSLSAVFSTVPSAQRIVSPTATSTLRRYVRIVPQNNSVANTGENITYTAAYARSQQG